MWRNTRFPRLCRVPSVMQCLFLLLILKTSGVMSGFPAQDDSEEGKPPEDTPKGASIQEGDIKTKIKEGSWMSINIEGTWTTQVGTYHQFDSHLAIDGDPNTYAKACEPCQPPTGLGWWRVYMKKLYKIAAVQVTSSSNMDDARLLDDFSVDVSSRDRPPVVCANYKADTVMFPSTTVSLQCEEPIEGDSVLVRRTRGSEYKPGIIAIAEVFLFAKK